MNNFDNLDSLNSALNSGAFVVSGDNVMVASWGFIGVMWGKKIFIAPIRDSRYTKEFIDKTEIFTVSVPKLGEMKAALSLCGSKSGRTVDKWTDANIQKQKAKAVDTSVVAGCEHYFECRVVSVLPCPASDNPSISKWYPTGDMHNFYFGEIVAEY